VPLQLNPLPDLPSTEQLSFGLTFRTLHLEGQLVDATVEAFLRAVEYASELGDPICVDMCGVFHIDRAGVRALVRATLLYRLVVVHPSAEVRLALESLGLCAYFGL
jgi:anti-anti-sigma regulatory factor